MSNGNALTPPEPATLRFFMERRLESFDRRRTYEYRALFGYLTLLVALGAALLQSTVKLEGQAKLILGALVFLSASAVIWFLWGIQRRNATERDWIKYYNRSLEGVATVRPQEDAELRRPTSQELWSFRPQVAFVALLTIAFILFFSADLQVPPSSTLGRFEKLDEEPYLALDTKTGRLCLTIDRNHRFVGEDFRHLPSCLELK